MPERGPQSYVRVLRRRSGLSQRELAFLLGRRGETRVSRIENARRPTSVPELILMELIFSCAGKDLFPRLYRQIAALLNSRIQKLQELERVSKTRKVARTSVKAIHLQRVIESMGSQASLESDER